MKRIKLAKPLIGRAERKAVIKVLKSGNLAQGPEVQNFELEFSRFVEERICVAVNSGTSGLHLALLSLGIGPGDEVILPSFTFAATANAISLTGATPIFIDIEPATYNLNENLIENAISRRTKAIMVVHLYGLAANMPAISNIAKKHNLLVIEDAAQAHLAEIDGKPVGTFGDAAVFSFYPTKNMTSGEGGMIVLNNSEAANYCRKQRNQGMEVRYKNELIGYNLRMSDIHAAIGRQQLQKLQKWTDKRIEIANTYSEKLRYFTTPLTPSGYKHVFHQYTIRVERNREHVMSGLEQSKIDCGVYYPIEVHKLPSYNCSFELKESNMATKEVLSIPVHPALTKREVSRVIEALHQIYESQ
ncbi:WecE Predicted pyridoxal phosphate-dependent enzyme apparently involved in regulation of cell wall biogenesis [Candidatus Nanopelagicaceae bacterium]